VDGFTGWKRPRNRRQREEEVIGSSVTEVYLAGREREGKREEDRDSERKSE